MKKYIHIFLLTSAVSLTIVPAINVYLDLTGAKNISEQGVRWFKDNNAYKVDFALQDLSYALYKEGVSSSPENVIIGKDGWLFLGDWHLKVMSESRGLTPFYKARIDGFVQARHKWDSFVKEQGGTGYFVSIAPNSHTIYRDMMPDWAAKSGHSKNIEYLLAKAPSDLTLVDLSVQLKSQKTTSDDYLYYKTDTHWNERGAWYGYQALKNTLSKSDPSLKWLSEQDIHLTQKERNGGDLSRFLRIAPRLTDTDVVVNFTQNSSLHITDWQGKEVREGDLSDRQKSMIPELVVNSSNALNHKKVLWLRDSFGISLYPYMNATFSTIKQRHYQEMLSHPENLKKLIREFKPDLVIVTAIERNAMLEYFGNFDDKNEPR